MEKTSVRTAMMANSSTTSPFDQDLSLYKAAAQEGWSIFECHGSQSGFWQIQGFDSPKDIAGIIGSMPPALSDREAWVKVMAGSRAHHVKARDFIKTANPNEYEAMRKAVGDSF